MAHLVFADKQPNVEKPKEPFLPMYNYIDEKKVICNPNFDNEENRNNRTEQ